jgi:hypothetical protein
LPLTFIFLTKKKMGDVTDLLTGSSTNLTALTNAWNDVISLVVNVLYTIFNFFLDFITANAWIVAFVVIIAVLYSVIKRYKSKVM